MQEKEKIIVFSSREICYQSSSFFANQMADAFEKLGFDERFRRMWLYYFGYCEAGFNARTISVVQLTAERV